MSEVTAATFVLAVADLEKSRAFYCDKLGLVEDATPDGHRIVFGQALP